MIAALALLFLIGAGAAMARADVALFEEEAVLQDNVRPSPLFLSSLSSPR